MGIQFAATIGLLCFGGYWLDQRLTTLPLFTLLGVFSGFGIGLYHLLRAVRPNDADGESAGGESAGGDSAGGDGVDGAGGGEGE